jgi:hypothetical protein
MPSSEMLRRVTLVKTDMVFLRSVSRLLVRANIVPSSPILVTLMVEVLRSCETAVLTRVTWRKIQEDGIIHEHLDDICCFLVVIASYGSAHVNLSELDPIAACSHTYL